jgi:hypothetical protein
MSGDPTPSTGYRDRTGEEGRGSALYSGSDAASYLRGRSFICWGLKVTEPWLEGSRFWKALCTFAMYGPTLA